MCNHSRTFDENGVTSCVKCGVCTNTPLTSNWSTTSYEQRHSPFSGGYSRHKRFRVLLNQLFFPTPCKGDEKMLAYFMDNKLSPIMSDVEQTLRLSGLRDKRYSSLHLFCRLFSPDYTKIKTRNLHGTMKQIVHHFDRFESAYSKMFTGFISYNYVMHYILESINMTSYLRFIKQTKCKYRKQLALLNFTF